jgi:hypothetical protein
MRDFFGYFLLAAALAIVLVTCLGCVASTQYAR